MWWFKKQDFGFQGFQLQDSFTNNYPRLYTTLQVECLTPWACYSRFILN